MPFHLLTGLAAVGVLAAPWFRRYRLARMAVGVQVPCIDGGRALAH
ncbi:MAG: hypothetical protein ACREL3_12980 [Gemmatimonadales bacterium]